MLEGRARCLSLRGAAPLNTADALVYPSPSSIRRASGNGVDVRICSREKTLVDCFKYRNKIGMDTVLDAIRFYRQSRRKKIDLLMRYAGIRRVARLMRPYLEAIL